MGDFFDISFSDALGAYIKHEEISANNQLAAAAMATATPEPVATIHNVQGEVDSAPSAVAQNAGLRKYAMPMGIGFGLLLATLVTYKVVVK